jgi:hypothetical protein
MPNHRVNFRVVLMGEFPEHDTFTKWDEIGSNGHVGTVEVCFELTFGWLSAETVKSQETEAADDIF